MVGLTGLEPATPWPPGLGRTSAGVRRCADSAGQRLARSAANRYEQQRTAGHYDTVTTKWMLRIAEIERITAELWGLEPTTGIVEISGLPGRYCTASVSDYMNNGGNENHGVKMVLLHARSTMGAASEEAHGLCYLRNARSALPEPATASCVT